MTVITITNPVYYVKQVSFIYDSSISTYVDFNIICLIFLQHAKRPWLQTQQSAKNIASLLSIFHYLKNIFPTIWSNIKQRDISDLNIQYRLQLESSALHFQIEKRGIDLYMIISSKLSCCMIILYDLYLMVNSNL